MVPGPTSRRNHLPAAESGGTPDADLGRDRLRTAALAAFGAKGFHATTTRDIARAAGLSPAALYVHHQSKEGLLHLISVTGHRELLDAMTRAVATATTPRNQLTALVRAFVSEHADKRAIARVVNDELDALTPDHRAEVDALRQAMDGIARDVVSRGVQHGEFVVADITLAARAILSMGQEVAHWFRPDGRWSADHVARAYAELALRMVGVGIRLDEP